MTTTITVAKKSAQGPPIITIGGVLSTIIDYHLYKKMIFPEANYHGGEVRVEVNTHSTPAETFHI